MARMSGLCAVITPRAMPMTLPSMNPRMISDSVTQRFVSNNPLTVFSTIDCQTA